MLYLVSVAEGSEAHPPHNREMVRIRSADGAANRHGGNPAPGVIINEWVWFDYQKS